jgi:hypothetical protein
MLWSAGWLIHGPVSNVACEQSVTRNQFALNLYEGRRVERSLNIRDKLAAAWASKAQRAEPRTSPCVGAPSGRRGDCFCLPTCQFGGRKAAWSNEPGLRACPIHLLELFYSDDIVCFSLAWVGGSPKIRKIRNRCRRRSETGLWHSEHRPSAARNT